MRPWVASCLIATVLLSTAGSARAAETASQAVAVLPLDIVGNVPAGRPALEQAVARGLAVLSGSTVGAAEAASKLTAASVKLPCDDGACWASAGRAVGARYLLSGIVERKGPLFEVQFRLVDAATGRLLATEKSGCEVADCSVAELCRQTVRELARQTLGAGSEAAVKPDGEPPGPGAVAAGATPGTNGGPQAGPILTDQASPRRVPAVLPVAAIAAGALSLGAGAFYIKRDGDCSTRDITVVLNDGSMRADCRRVHNTLWPGVGLLGAGAALIGTGLVLALWRPGGGEAGGPPYLTIGPGSVGLGGRF